MEPVTKEAYDAFVSDLANYCSLEIKSNNNAVITGGLRAGCTAAYVDEKGQHHIDRELMEVAQPYNSPSAIGRHADKPEKKPKTTYTTIYKVNEVARSYQTKTLTAKHAKLRKEFNGETWEGGTLAGGAFPVVMDGTIVTRMD